MQKTILRNNGAPASSSDEWLSIDAIAGIGVTSETVDAPVENVLYPDREVGWRAGETGPQIIQLTFSAPTNIRRLQIVFKEPELARTQEFTVRYIAAGGESREIVRQQWTFSPQGSTEEAEDYRLSLEHVVVLELTINPDISHGGAHASLLRLRIA